MEAPTLGGITGIAASAITKSGKRTKYAMGGGAALCAVFARLLLKGYKNADNSCKRESFKD